MSTASSVELRELASKSIKRTDTRDFGVEFVIQSTMLTNSEIEPEFVKMFGVEKFRGRESGDSCFVMFVKWW